MADTTPSTTPIDLSQCSIRYLRQVLNSLNWATDLFSLTHGGEAFEALPEPETEPVLLGNFTPDDLVTFRAAEKTWSEKRIPAFELTAKQRKAVKKCLTFYVEKGAFQPNRHSLELFRVFGVTPKDDSAE